MDEVEKVARAMARGMGLDPDQVSKMAPTVPYWRIYEKGAKAAIAALDAAPAESADERRCTTCDATDPKANMWCSNGFHVPAPETPDERQAAIVAWLDSLTLHEKVLGTVQGDPPTAVAWAIKDAIESGRWRRT